MNFENALSALKQGNKVCREGWNGKNQFLYHVPANSYPAVTKIAKDEFNDMVPYGAYIAIKNAQNYVVPWVPSQGDIFAEDWTLVN